MKNYIFINNKNKTIEEIILIYVERETIYCKIIGDIYSLVEYINNNVQDKTKIDFLNFQVDKLKFITNTIIKYKKIERVEEYNSIVISSKKKIRGIKHDKMD